MNLVVGCWLALFGIWPLFDPAHSLIDGPLGVVDIGFHIYGTALICREIRD